MGGESGAGSVQSVSLDPGQQLIQGSYRSYPELGELMGRQMEELFSAGGIQYVPYFGASGPDSIDGYYTLDQADVGPADASTGAVQTYDGTVTKAGTKKTHLRAVRVAPTAVDTVGASNYSDDDPPANPEQVMLPTDVRRPRWFDPLSGTVEPAEPLNRWQYPETAGELVDFRTYALSSASFYDPTDAAPTPPALVYEYPYGREFRMDVRCWDTTPGVKGERKVIEGDLAAGSRVGGPDAVVGEAVVGESPAEHNVAVAAAWQRCFRAGHEFRGACVLDNGVLRLHLDDERGSISAERSRGHFSEWAAQPLRASKWALADVDVTHIGLARVDAQIEWRHGDTGDLYATDCSLPRGHEDAIFTVAQNQTGAAPHGLAQKLAPIAKFGGVTVRTPHTTADIIPREDLRK